MKESEARSTGVQLKIAAKPSTVIELITKHADCCITLRLSQEFTVLRSVVKKINQEDAMRVIATDRQTVNYNSTSQALELIYFDSNKTLKSSNTQLNVSYHFRNIG